MLKLGDVVKDRLSGFAGTVTGRAEYLFGCVQVLVNPRAVKDGSPVAGTWLDEDRCEALAAAGTPRPASADERAGGPVAIPPPSGAR